MSTVLLRKLGRDLWSRKLAVATLAGILAVGIGCWVGFASLYRDLTGARARYYREHRIADVLVEVKHAPRHTLREVRRLPAVLSVRDRVVQPILLDMPSIPEPVTGMAFSMPHDRPPDLHDAYLTAGSWFSGPEAREVVLNHQFAVAHGIGPGDRIRFTLRGELLDLLVVGTAMDPQFVWIVPPGGGLAPDPERYGIVYLPRRFLARHALLEGAYNQLLATLRDPSPAAAEAVLVQLEHLLDPYGVTATSRMEENASVKMLDDEIQGLRVSNRILPTIFLAVAALVLHVLLGRLVSQERTVIGTLKALGYTRSTLARHYLAFGLAVGLLGGLAGLGIAWQMETASVKIYAEMFAMPGIEARPAYDLWAIGLLIGAVTATLGALDAILRVNRLDPAESMRPPPPEQGRRILPERFPGLWESLGFRTRLVLRSIFRNPFRNLVTILATFFGTALTLTTISLTASVDVLMSFHFEKISHEDVSVSLRDPAGPEVIRELARIPGVKLAEGQMNVAADLSSGSRSKRLGIQGLPAGARLYTPVDPEGNTIVVPEKGLVMSRKLAEILDVTPGDLVDVRMLTGRRERTTARLTAVMETFLGISVYADNRYLARLLGEEEAYNQVLLQLDHSVPLEAVMRELKKRPDVTGLGERRRNLTHLQETFGDVQLVSLGILVFFAGMIAFGSVLNTALVTLSERRQEVATFRVLGYQPPVIGALFAAEGMSLNGIGILLGLLGGVGLTRLTAWAYDTELYRFPAMNPPDKIIQTIVIMFLFVGFAQRFITRAIRRVDWLEALSVKE